MMGGGGRGEGGGLVSCSEIEGMRWKAGDDL